MRYQNLQGGWWRSAGIKKLLKHFVACAIRSLLQQEIWYVLFMGGLCIGWRLLVLRALSSHHGTWCIFGKISPSSSMGAIYCASSSPSDDFECNYRHVTTILGDQHHELLFINNIRSKNTYQGYWKLKANYLSSKPAILRVIVYLPLSASVWSCSSSPCQQSGPWILLVDEISCYLLSPIWRGVFWPQDAAFWYQRNLELGYLWLPFLSTCLQLYMGLVRYLHLSCVYGNLVWLKIAGIGPIPSIYFSEAFPLSHRELGAAFTICINNSVGSALSLTFPSLLKKTTPTGGKDS